MHELSRSDWELTLKQLKGQLGQCWIQYEALVGSIKQVEGILESLPEDKVDDVI